MSIGSRMMVSKFQGLGKVGERERRWIMRTGRVLSTAIYKIIRMDNN